MLDLAIEEFLAERKTDWLKKHIKPSNQTDEEQNVLKEEAEKRFLLENWLVDKSPNAKGLNLVTHPSKYSHSSAKTSPVMALKKASNDGLLRFGNATCLEIDVLGSASYLDVYRFVSLILQNGDSVLKNLESNTDYIKKQLAVLGESFDTVKDNLLMIKIDSSASVATAEKVKQVYFPLKHDEEYHLLSILTSSSMIFKMKEKIDFYRFSEEVKAAKEARKQNKYFEGGFKNISNLTEISYGGANKQNVSYLNSKYRGTSYLLESLPPDLSSRNIRLPKKDFFNQTLWAKSFESIFSQLNYVLADWRNNIDIRLKRDELFAEAVYQTSEFLWKVRSIEAGWSNSDTYNELPQWQKLWLDSAYETERTESDNYIEQAVQGFSRWFINAFEAYLKLEKIKFDDTDILHFIQQANQFDTSTQLQIKEAFR